MLHPKIRPRVRFSLDQTSRLHLHLQFYPEWNNSAEPEPALESGLKRCLLSTGISSATISLSLSLSLTLSLTLFLSLLLSLFLSLSSLSLCVREVRVRLAEACIRKKDGT